MPRELRAAAITLAILLLGSSCPEGHAQEHPLEGAHQVARIERHQAIRDRTATRFSHAAFISPENSSTVGNRVWMAPLVIQEQAPNSMESPRCGALTVAGSQVTSIDTRRPTIYMTSGNVQIDEKRHPQQTYLWFYHAKSQGAAPQWRGFRQTLGKQGFAFVWELISSENAQLRVFFVSKSLEQEAARQFGSPLTGRRFSAEADLRTHPATVVARVVPNGPQPMGPYVHLNHESLLITTLRCRCEPSLIGHFLGNDRYRLVPLKHLADLLADVTPRPEMRLPADTAELDGVLRFPASR